jgi:pimeloyl-ACP methyl ester carboxylesterase
LIALDLPGCGKSFRSETPEQDYSIKGLSKHVKDFLQDFNKNPYIIIACSLGANLIGEISDELLNCKGVMLLSPTIIGFNLTVADILKPNPNLAPLFSANSTDEQLNLLVDELGNNLNHNLKEDVKTIFNAVDPNFRTSMAASIGTSDYTDELQKLQNSNLPIAVVFGEEDKICFTNYIDKTPLTKWHHKSILVPNSGHCVMLEQPKKLVEIIKEFAENCF